MKMASGAAACFLEWQVNIWFSRYAPPVQANPDGPRLRDLPVILSRSHKTNREMRLYLDMSVHMH